VYIELLTKPIMVPGTNATDAYCGIVAVPFYCSEWIKTKKQSIMTRLQKRANAVAAVILINGSGFVMPPLIYANNTIVQSVINNGTPVITNPTPPAPSTPVTTTGSSATVSGTATPNSSLTVKDNSRPVATANSTASGSFTTTVPLTTGQNSITVQSQGSDASGGNTTPVNSQPLTITRKPTLLDHLKKVALFAGGGLLLLILLVLIILAVKRSRRRAQGPL
jgi:hypothetical protein